MDNASTLIDNLKGFGGYTTTLTIIVGALITWWKVLPALIDAISNRQSKIEERMGALLEDTTKRFQSQLDAADKRHADCMAGHDRLQLEVDTLRAKCISLQDEMSGMRAQARQMQMSTIEVIARADADKTVQAVETLRGIDYPVIGK